MVCAPRATEAQRPGSAATQFLTIPVDHIGACRPAILPKGIAENPRTRNWIGGSSLDIGSGPASPTRLLSVITDSAGRVVQFSELLDYMTSERTASLESVSAVFASSGTVTGFRIRYSSGQEKSVPSPTPLDTSDVRRVKLLAEWLQQRCKG